MPLTARGGGTSQAGQSIGPGVILDCSKYFNRVLEINPAERWARVEPGCVLDDLNRAVRPHNLQFAPDISTSSRATIGGMVANNSSGTRSVYYGKTIDHVAALKVVLADGTVVAARAARAPTSSRPAAASRTWKGRCYRITRQLAAEHADEIERRFPKILRRVGGYNLDAFVPGRPAIGGDDRFNLAHLLVGSEGTLAVTLEATLRLVEIPRAKVVARRRVRRPARRPWGVAGRSSRTGRRPSRSSTSTCSTAPSSTPTPRGSATSSTATPARS